MPRKGGVVKRGVLPDLKYNDMLVSRFINGLMKHDWLDAFLFAVAIAVGLTPEMLPMIVNANLARGAIAMSRQKTIVKRLHAIQNFGAMDVLCTDKTGTLTQDKVVLIRHVDLHGSDSKRVLEHAYLNSLFQTGLKNLLDRAVIDRAQELGLREVAKIMIYEHHWEPQDIEFTFEGPGTEDLYILQTRNMEMRERKRVPAFSDSGELSEKIFGHGIGVSGGALSGRVVFSLDDISSWKKTEPETPLILIRNDTVPDDIREISEADGLLTARGGATSHAAIVATRLGKTCVVGCRDLVCMENERKFELSGKVVHAGEFISIDGAEGSIYSGKMKVGTVEG